MAWVHTRRLRQLASEAEALGRKRLPEDKRWREKEKGKGTARPHPWPRSRAIRQHDMLEEIDLELRNFLDHKSARSLRALTRKWLRKVETANSVWAAYAIARDALKTLAPLLLRLADVVEPEPTRKVRN